MKLLTFGIAFISKANKLAATSINETHLNSLRASLTQEKAPLL